MRTSQLIAIGFISGLTGVLVAAGCGRKAGDEPPDKEPAEPATAKPTVDQPDPGTRQFRSRVEFAASMAKVRPGMPASEVEKLLGPPEDIRTERDPGGIGAARTAEVWRWGTRGHLTTATLGVVHMLADKTVQYAFGGQGTPPADIDEGQLRALIDVLDRLPSYNDRQYNPRAVIHAVNALHPLGKDRAVAVMAEYLRVTSPYDNPAREGLFFVLRTLFDVPAEAGHMPPMKIGAPTPAPPADPRTLPRFPIVIEKDIPFYVATGYTLAGQPESPVDHLAYFREHGTLRAKPLAPTIRPVELFEELFGKPGTEFLKRTSLDHEAGRAHLMNQALWIMETVYRPETSKYGDRFWYEGSLDERWEGHTKLARQLIVRWDTRAQRYMFRSGMALGEELLQHYQRHIWPVALGDASAKVIFERKDSRYVTVEVRVEVPPGKTAPKARVTVLAVKGGDKLAELELPAQTAPAESAATAVTSEVFALVVSHQVRAQVEMAGKKAEKSPAFKP